ncbi:MAG: DUF4931 domain-containing protein [Candidatus Sumerlaeota bacterium]|nr:DUF4931 domain-containing protein [Candidatus Sumerlaeota bacterium]
MSILRKDPVSSGWVIMAEDRAIRPHDTKSPEVVRSDSANCPFCEGKEGVTPPEIVAYRGAGSPPNGPKWRVRTIPNKFAALRIEGDLERRGEGMYDAMNGIGAHEVIIETPNHMGRMGEYPVESLAEILRMYRDRVRDLYQDERFRYIQVFRNYGSIAGASLSHPHSQLIAIPITPRWVKEELICSKEHWQTKERCIFCDILRQEESDAERVVFKNDRFVSFAPYASKFPFETWILPRRHNSEFRNIEDSELRPLAEALGGTLWALQQALDDPPFNYIIHSAPRISMDRYAKSALSIDKDYHWHIEIIPRTTRMAGFEWGTGFYINPTMPEAAAEYLRTALKDRA